jgi:hypothetical protein
MLIMPEGQDPETAAVLLQIFLAMGTQGDQTLAVLGLLLLLVQQ